MTVSLCPENYRRGMEFIESWIQNGSYSVYGGEKKLSRKNVNNFRRKNLKISMSKERQIIQKQRRKV